MERAFRILMLVFGLIGVVFMAIGGIAGVEHVLFAERAERVEGIIEVASYDTLLVAYTYGGEDYRVRLSYESDGFYPGREVTLLVDPAAPEQARLDALPLLTLVFCIIGGAFLLVLLILAILLWRSKSRRNRLLGLGHQVTAQIIDVEINRNTRVNGRSPYVIVCQWTDPDDDGVTYLFRSAGLWFNPEPLLRERGITELSVYLDPYNKKHYHVNLEPVQDKVVAL